MESINGLYKAECIRTTIFHHGPYKTLADVEYATAGWVDWYNQRRLHGSWHDQSHRVRNRPLRDPQPRAATRMRAAENLGRFIVGTEVTVRVGVGHVVLPRGDSPGRDSSGLGISGPSRLVWFLLRGQDDCRAWPNRVPVLALGEWLGRVGEVLRGAEGGVHQPVPELVGG